MSQNGGGGKPLANPPAMRGFSDRLDKAFGWEGKYKEESKVRATIHAAWHTGAGVVTNNSKEYDRAREQYSKVTGRPPSPPSKTE